ncbi:MAG: VWA domain-containing protein [Nanoarchaeota archaeon]
MEVIFEKPDYLWLLFVVPIIMIVHFLTLKVTNRKALKFANFEIMERVTGGQSLSKNFFLLIIRTIIMLLFILALAGVNITYLGQGSNHDFAIVLDSSNSMLVQDLKPNRMEVAKLRAEEFIDKLNSNNNIAIVTFGSTAFVESSLSNDPIETKTIISSIEARKTGGTASGDAIVTGVNSLILSKNSKIIILITDGRSNVGIDVDTAIEYAKLKQVIIHSIGIGTTQGGEYTTGVNLTLDELTLQRISSETNGKYFKIISSEDLANAYNEIAGLTETTVYRDLTLAFTLSALFLLLIEWILFNTKYRTIP